MKCNLEAKKGKKVVVDWKFQALGSIDGGQVVVGSRIATLNEESPEINDKINVIHGKSKEHNELTYVAPEIESEMAHQRGS